MGSYTRLRRKVSYFLLEADKHLVQVAALKIKHDLREVLSYIGKRERMINGLTMEVIDYV